MNRTATFTLEERDLRRATRLHVFNLFRKTRTVVSLTALWVIAVGVFVAYIRARGAAWAEIRVMLPVFAVAAAATILAVNIVLPLVLNRFAIRRRFQQDKLVRLPVSVSWDDEAYEAEQPGVHNRIAWRDYMRRCEDQHLFVFFLSDYNYQVLPKRALTPEQVEDVRRVLSAI